MGGRGKFLGGVGEITRKLQLVEIFNLMEDERRGIERRIQEYKQNPFRDMDDDISAMLSIDDDGYISIKKDKTMAKDINEWWLSEEKKKNTEQEWFEYREGAHGRFSPGEVYLGELEDALGDEGADRGGDPWGVDDMVDRLYLDEYERSMGESSRLSYDEREIRYGDYLQRAERQQRERERERSKSGVWSGDLAWLNELDS